MAEITCTCERCGTFWYIDEAEVRALQSSISWNKAIGVMAFIGSLGGDYRSQRTLDRAADQQHLNRLEADLLTHCPRCRSAQFSVERPDSPLISQSVVAHGYDVTLHTPVRTYVPGERPTGVTALAILIGFQGAITLLGALLALILLAVIALSGELPSDQGLANVLTGIAGGVVSAAVGALFLKIAQDLWRLRPWARTAAIVLAAIILLAFPVGTLIGGFALWYLYRPEVKACFGSG